MSYILFNNGVCGSPNRNFRYKLIKLPFINNFCSNSVNTRIIATELVMYLPGHIASAMVTLPIKRTIFNSILQESRANFLKTHFLNILCTTYHN